MKKECINFIVIDLELNDLLDLTDVITFIILAVKKTLNLQNLKKMTCNHLFVVLKQILFYIQNLIISFSVLYSVLRVFYTFVFNSRLIVHTWMKVI